MTVKIKYQKEGRVVEVLPGGLEGPEWKKSWSSNFGCPPPSPS